MKARLLTGLNLAERSGDQLTMGAEDIEQLTRLARRIKRAVVVVAIEMGLLGVLTALCVMAFYTIVIRHRKGKRTWLMLSAIFCAGAFTALEASLDVTSLFLRIRANLIDRPDLPFAERMAAYASLSWWKAERYLEMILLPASDAGLVFLLNDVLASWRALVFWRSVPGSNRSLPLLLYFVLFSNFAFSVAITVTMCIYIDVSVSNNSDPLAIVMITQSALSIATNLIATGMTGYRAYAHRAFASRSGIKSSGARFLLLLTESGMLYAAIQIVRLALSLCIVPTTPLYSPLDTANTVFQVSSAVVSAMYTPALILIINYGYSLADTIQLGTGMSTRDASSGPAAIKDLKGDRTMSEIRFQGNDVGRTVDSAHAARVSDYKETGNSEVMNTEANTDEQTTLEETYDDGHRETRGVRSLEYSQ